MRNERLKLIQLIMLYFSLIVFIISLFAFLNIKKEEFLKLKHNKSIELRKRKMINK